MIVLVLVHLVFLIVLLGCRQDLFRKVPILPEEYGPLSLVNGMMFWESQIPHRIFHNHRIRSSNSMDFFSFLELMVKRGDETAAFLRLLFGSQGGNDMRIKPTKKDHMACKHMEMDLLVAISKEIFALQNDTFPLLDASGFSRRIWLLCEANPAFQKSLEEADRRAVADQETLEMLRGLRRDLSSLKFKKASPPISLNTVHFRGKIYLEDGFSHFLYLKFKPFLVPSKLIAINQLLLKHPRSNLRPEALKELLWRVSHVADLTDSTTEKYCYPAIRMWFKRSYPELKISRMLTNNSIAKALGCSSSNLRDGACLRQLIVNEIQKYPLGNEIAEMFRLIKAKKNFGKVLYKLSPHQKALLGEELWEELKELSFQIARHLHQLEVLNDLIESLQKKAAMGGAAEGIWGNLMLLSFALYEAVKNVPAQLPRTAVLSLWLSYIYARYPDGIELYYGQLSSLLGIEFQPRPTQGQRPPFFQTEMTMKNLEDSFFTFDASPSEVLQVYLPREEVDQFFQGISFPVCVEEAIYHFARAIGIDLKRGFEEFCEALQNRRDLVYYSLIRGGTRLEPGASSEQHQFFPTKGDGFVHRSFISGWKEGTFERGEVTLQAVCTQERATFDTVTVDSKVMFMLFGDEDLPYEVAPSMGNILRVIEFARNGFSRTGLTLSEEEDEVSERLERLHQETGLQLDLKHSDEQGEPLLQLIHVNKTMKAAIKITPGHCHTRIKSLLRVAGHDEILSDFQDKPTRYLADPLLLTYLLYFVRSDCPSNLHGLKGFLYRGKKVLLESMEEFLAIETSPLWVLLQFPQIGESAEFLLDAIQHSPDVSKKLNAYIMVLEEGQFEKAVLGSKFGGFYVRAFPLLDIQTRLALLDGMPEPAVHLAGILRREGKSLMRLPCGCRGLVKAISRYWDELLLVDADLVWTVDPLFTPFFEASRQLTEMGVSDIGPSLGKYMDVVCEAGKARFRFSSDKPVAK